jgi:hypothetical protein
MELSSGTSALGGLVRPFQTLLLLGFSSGICLGDAPLRPPTPIIVCSNSGAFCLLSDPKSGAQAYRVRPDGSRQPLWSIPGYAGFNASGNFVVSTVERDSVAFDVTTGKEVGR